jgi:hypothetical protein
MNRRKLILAAAGLAVVLLGVGALVRLWRSNRSTRENFARIQLGVMSRTDVEVILGKSNFDFSRACYVLLRAFRAIRIVRKASQCQPASVWVSRS